MPEPQATLSQLADALCARLCHDLASPLGTLMNALELMADDPAAAADALALASEAALGMGRRLKLLRAAWAGDCGPLDAAGLADLALGLPPRVRAELGGLHPGEHDGAAARVLVNLLLLGAEALPRGGAVSLSGQPGGDILVMVQGASAAWPAALWAALADPAAGAFEPRHVQPPLVAMLARAAGLRLSVLMPAGSGSSAAPPLLLAPG